MSYHNRNEQAEERQRRAELEATRRRVEAARERTDWAELKHIYERCVAIAEKVWTAKLDTAAAQQQALAEAMRDRGGIWYQDANAEPRVIEGQEIHVPLFTPRDRLQFLKEASVSLLISADRRNLTALYKDTNGEAELAQAQEAPAGASPVEAASGTAETLPDEADPYATPGERVRVPQETPPSL